MNSQGSIARFETEADAKAAGYRTNLTDAEAATLLRENRKERRARLAQVRREMRKAKRSKR